MVYGDIETRTGGFRYDRRLIATLRERGAAVEVVELPWRSSSAGLLAGAAGRPVAHVVRSIDGPVDVLLQDELAHPSLVGCNGRLRARVGAPLVSVVHHLRSSEPAYVPAKRCYRAVERRYLSGIDGAIATSRATRTAIRTLASPPSLVAPPAADRFEPGVDDRSVERRARETPLRVVFVGDVARRKGVDTLVEALGTADSAGGWELTVVGSLEAEPGRVHGGRRRPGGPGNSTRTAPPPPR